MSEPGTPATQVPVTRAPITEAVPLAPELTAAAPRRRSFDAADTEGLVLLAIDTALGSSVAVCSGGRVVEHSSDDPMRHTEVLGALLEAALAEAGVHANDIAGVVYGVGPGPFTGLRVGIAAARAFALGRSAPVYPLHSHEAVALALFDEASDEAADDSTESVDLADSPGATAVSRVRIVQDARRRELFVTDYSGLDAAGIPLREAGPRIEPREGYAASQADVWPERVPAARLLQLAARRLASGREFEQDTALYLRTPDVNVSAGRKRVVP